MSSQRGKIVSGVSANPPGITRRIPPRIYSPLSVSDPRAPGLLSWPPKKKTYQPPPSYKVHDFTKPQPQTHPAILVGKLAWLGWKAYKEHQEKKELAEKVAKYETENASSVNLSSEFEACLDAISVLCLPPLPSGSPRAFDLAGLVAQFPGWQAFGTSAEQARTAIAEARAQRPTAEVRERARVVAARTLGKAEAILKANYRTIPCPPWGTDLHLYGAFAAESLLRRYHDYLFELLAFERDDFTSRERPYFTMENPEESLAELESAARETFPDVMDLTTLPEAARQVLSFQANPTGREAGDRYGAALGALLLEIDIRMRARHFSA
ncbi:hypothetical protein [Streptomyces sp. NPDC090025]|uniref:hypothetical protein n=1 Tax=Streptomyces sp. NPDC090025 TaxID=3365922 RepID=UPI003836ABD1